MEGRARERSRSVCSQSKRALASACTVLARSAVTVWKSAYGFSSAARFTVSSFLVLTAARVAWRSLMTLPVST